MTGRHDGTVLSDPDDGVVATVGDVEVGTLLEGGVARPVRVGCFHRGGCEVHRFVEGGRSDPVYQPGLEDQPVVMKVDRRDGVGEGLADVQRPAGSVVDDHADAYGDPLAIRDPAQD